jgi:hypothetical protein
LCALCSFLARSYAAEALCMLSRAADATETLQSERNLITMADEYAREAGIQVRTALVVLGSSQSADMICCCHLHSSLVRVLGST